MLCSPVLRDITLQYNLWIPNMFIETANNISAIILNGSGHSKNDVIKFPNQEGISNFLSEACVVSQSRGWAVVRLLNLFNAISTSLN